MGVCGDPPDDRWCAERHLGHRRHRRSKLLRADQRYILSGLSTWGWVTLIIGVVELVAAFSLFSGGGFGRWVGIFAASLASISALLSIPAYPLWSLCVFALSLVILFELAKAPERGAVS